MSENNTPSPLVDELLQKHIRKGSSFYYSIWYLSDDNKIKYKNLFSLFQEWLSLYNNSHEPQIAHTALHWWLEQLQSPEPDHPLLLTLMQSLESTPELKQQIIQHLQEIIIALLHCQHHYQDSDALDEFLRKTWGNLCVVLGTVLGLCSNKSGETSIKIHQQTGVLLGHYQLIKYLPRQLTKQRCPVPQDLMNKLDVTPAKLIEILSSTDIYSATQAKKKEFLDEISNTFNRHHSTLDQLLTNINDPVSQHLALPCHTALQLQRQWFNSTLKKRFQIFNYRLQLPQIRKRWISWRCKNK